MSKCKSNEEKMSNDSLSKLQNKILDKLKTNKLWQQKTDDDYWVCPYCGLVGAHFEAPDKMLPEVESFAKARVWGKPSTRNYRQQWR